MTSITRAFLAVAAVFVCIFAAVQASFAQTASFNFNDGSGPTDAGSYPAGASFTFSVSLMFAQGGSVNNLAGISYFFEQQSPSAPFYFGITNRDVTGSQFTFLQTPNPTYPQTLKPSNQSDLGGQTQSGQGLGAGNYFVANLTVSIDPSTPPGTYIIENTSTGGKRSVVSDSQGHTFGIPLTTYTITVVPFTITITPEASGNMLLQCQGVPNQVNRIEWSPNMSPNSFQTLYSFTPDMSGAFSFEDQSPGTVKFYRLAFP